MAGRIISPLIPIATGVLRRPRNPVVRYLPVWKDCREGEAVVSVVPVTDKKQLDRIRQRVLRFMKSKANEVKKKEYQVIRDRANYVWILRTY